MAADRDKETSKGFDSEIGHLYGPNPYISLNSTYFRGQRSVYARDTNPTWEYLEAEVGRLEGGRCIVFASGMGAISSIVAAVEGRKTLFLAEDSYNGTRRLAQYLSDIGRLHLNMVTQKQLSSLCFITDASPGDILFYESPSNPHLNLYDIAAISRVCRDHGVVSVVDSTLATPFLQRPLSLGADVVVHSLTKALSGHSDVLGGAVVTKDPELDSLFRLRRSLLGAIPSAWDVYLILRGLKTAELRVDRASKNAYSSLFVFFKYLDPSRIYYPYHPSSPTLELAMRQMTGGGGVVSVVFEDEATAERFLDALRQFHKATSLGGVESLAERRAIHKGEEGTHPGLVRLSFGIEPWDLLEQDLVQALETALRQS